MWNSPQTFSTRWLKLISIRLINQQHLKESPQTFNLHATRYFQSEFPGSLKGSTNGAHGSIIAAPNVILVLRLSETPGIFRRTGSQLDGITRSIHKHVGLEVYTILVNVFNLIWKCTPLQKCVYLATVSRPNLVGESHDEFGNVLETLQKGGETVMPERGLEGYW